MRSRARRPHTAVALPVTRGSVADVAGLPGERLALAAEAPVVPEGELVPAEVDGWRFGAWGGEGGGRAGRGEVPDPADLVAACGVPAGHRARREGAAGGVPENLVFDTEIGAYLLDPARRGYPLHELAEERGMAVAADDDVAGKAGSSTRWPSARPSSSPSAGWSTSWDEHRAAPGEGAALHGDGGHPARRPRG